MNGISVMSHNPDFDNQIETQSNEIMLIVKMNNGEAFILKEQIKLIYYKFGNDTIIGTDGTFYTFYMKDWVSWSQDAFAGRKFTLTMHDGEEILCEGRWWDAMSPTAKMLLEDTELVHIAANDLKRLQDCYVYSGYQGDKQKLKILRDKYIGPVYEYYEGECIINSWKKQHGKLIKLFRDYKGDLSAIDEHHNHYEIRTIKGKLYFRYRSHIKPDDWYNKVFTEGIKDFSIKQPRKKPEYHICYMCGAKDGIIHSYDDQYYCHKCEKEMEAEDNRQNYYL